MPRTNPPPQFARSERHSHDVPQRPRQPTPSYTFSVSDNDTMTWLETRRAQFEQSLEETYRLIDAMSDCLHRSQSRRLSPPCRTLARGRSGPQLIVECEEPLCVVSRACLSDAAMSLDRALRFFVAEDAEGNAASFQEDWFDEGCSTLELEEEWSPARHHAERARAEVARAGASNRMVALRSIDVELSVSAHPWTMVADHRGDDVPEDAFTGALRLPRHYFRYDPEPGLYHTRRLL